MSDELADPPCPDCGEPMELSIGEGAKRQVGPNGTLSMELPVGRQCENPDCPSSDSDVAPMSKGEQEKWLNQPGSEGGANGGA